MLGFYGDLNSKVYLNYSKQYDYLQVLFFRELAYLFEERLEIQAIADDITSKYVPPHVNIFYVRFIDSVYKSFLDHSSI